MSAVYGVTLTARDLTATAQTESAVQVHEAGTPSYARGNVTILGTPSEIRALALAMLAATDAMTEA